MTSLGSAFGEIFLSNALARGLQAPVVAAYGEGGVGKTCLFNGCFNAFAPLKTHWRLSRSDKVTEKTVGNIRLRHLDCANHADSFIKKTSLDKVLVPRESIKEPGFDCVEHAPFSIWDKPIVVIVACQDLVRDAEDDGFYHRFMRDHLDDVGKDATSSLAEMRDFLLMEAFSYPIQIVTPQRRCSPRIVSIALKAKDESAKRIFGDFKRHVENNFPQP